MWSDTSDEGKLLRKYSRQINNALALASQAVKENFPAHGGWTPSVIIQGKLYHRIGSMVNDNSGRPPAFAQIFVRDPMHDEEEENIRLGHMRLPAKTTPAERDKLLAILQKLQVRFH